MNLTGKSLIDQSLIEWAIRLRYSPMPDLSMENLTSQLNAFRIGDLRMAGRTWEIMMERDGDLGGDANKRFEELASREWEIMQVEKTPEAQRHADALKYFYDNVRATSALEQDEIGDVSMLLYQLASAIAYRYSVHEMILRVDSPKERKVTAELRHMPVWFFESRRGYLGYLQHIYDVYGQPLQEGEWLSAVGKGWMRACSVAYLLKHYPLSDWMLYSRRFGMPGVQGLTDAQKDSQEWNDFAAALAAFSNDWVTLTNRSSEIKLIEAAGKGELPFEKLVEMVNRLYSKLFRGSDLASQSRVSTGGGNAVGASVQGGEKDVLGKYDCRWATGVLNARIDTPVIRYLFNAEPKAFIKIIHPDEDDTQLDLQSAAFCIANGVPISVKVARERFNWPEPEPGEPVLTPSMIASNPQRPDGAEPAKDNGAEADGADPARQPQTANPNMPGTRNGQLPEMARSVANSADATSLVLLKNALPGVAAARAHDLKPLADRIAGIVELDNADLQAAALKKLKADLADPKSALFAILRNPTLATQLANSMTAAFFNGVATAEASQHRALDNSLDESALANFNDGQARDSLGKWVDENGGGLSEHDNIARGRNARDRALRTKADVQKAMYRKEVGQIDFNWGTPGETKNDYAGGHGISHILAKHGEAAVNDLPVVLAKGKITPHPESEDKRLVQHGDSLVSLVRKNSRSAWVLTSYQRKTR